MEITFLNEHFSQGLTVDWPIIPRPGDLLSFQYEGGTSLMHVDNVVYNTRNDGELDSVSVQLSNRERPRASD